MKRQSVLVLIVFLGVVNITSADMIQGINMDFVTIGNAGNLGDSSVSMVTDGSSGYGSVDYVYKIGKYEITNAQWDAFVSAAGAPTGNPSNAYGESAYYTGVQQPTNRVSWYEVAQFCNYLTSGDKSLGAYLFSNGDFTVIDRNSAISAYGIAYVIPTEDEWYKAAYYTGSGYSLYANGTDVAPIAGVDTNYDNVIGQPWDVGTGTMEQNGTFDMMGNVAEWNETVLQTTGRGIRGGPYPCDDSYLRSSYQSYDNMFSESDSQGFRVVEVVPLPSAVILGSLGLTFSGWLLKRKRMV